MSLVTEVRVQETLQCAGFLHRHRELRSRSRIEISITGTGGDRYDVAAGLLARGVAVHSESEATRVVLLRNIHVCCLLVNLARCLVSYQHLDCNTAPLIVHDCVYLFSLPPPRRRDSRCTEGQNVQRGEPKKSRVNRFNCKHLYLFGVMCYFSCKFRW